MFPAFGGFDVDELHLEMASRELSESDLVRDLAEHKDVAVGIVDVKSSWIEPSEEVAARVRHFLRLAPPERLSFAPDCGLSQTARWVARAKLENLVAGVRTVREELGV
jgi:5-methyltetrahydropteroyltriglutamate--homocysteine methyltransferase